MFCGLTINGADVVRLKKPNLKRGMPVMTAFSLRASASGYNTKPLSLEDLSDLLWAANGINREDEGKRTAPTAVNAQDIDLYVFLPEAVYLYNAKENQLEKVAEGDNRKLVAAQQEDVAKAPVICLMVSDISRFPWGDDNSKLSMAAKDAGIVSQNISIFCAGTGLVTRPRASMNVQGLRELLKLKDSQHPLMNNPVSYKPE